MQAFTSDFTFQLTSPSADGFTFVIQNAGTTALGPTGGGLGYGPDNVTNPSASANTPIAKSVAVKFDLYNNAGEGTNTTGLYTNGASPTTPATTLGGGVNLHSGDTFKVHLNYDGTTLTMTITDTVNTTQTFTTSWPINIPSTVGANTAFVGFTGGVGGSTAIQEIITWSLNSSSASKTPVVYQTAKLAAVSSGPTFRQFTYSAFPERHRHHHRCHQSRRQRHFHRQRRHRWHLRHQVVVQEIQHARNLAARHQRHQRRRYLRSIFCR